MIFENCKLRTFEIAGKVIFVCRVFSFIVPREGVKEMILRPHVFHCRPEFLMIWGVYAATYVTANMIMTTCDRSKVDDTWPKFIGTTFVNITTVVAKVSSLDSEKW